MQDTQLILTRHRPPARPLKRKMEEYADIRAQRQVAFELSGDGWHVNPEFYRAQHMEAKRKREIKKLVDILTLK